MATLTLIHDAPTESGFTIWLGRSIYLGHVVGGMVRVKFNDVIYVIHPATTKELG